MEIADHEARWLKSGRGNFARWAGIARINGARISGLWPVLIVALVSTLAIGINPIGYIGGGGDDWEYLQAARCAAQHGICTPQSHWWVRLPLVVPVGAGIALFGESRQALWLVPFLYSSAIAILFVTIVQRQFGNLAAVIGGLLLVATPIFRQRALSFTVDAPELAWILASVLMLQCALSGYRSRFGLLAGVFAGLAVMCRPTALVFAMIAGGILMLIPTARQRLLLPFIGGVIAMLGAEALCYWTFLGDPAFGWKLSLGHTRIPSEALKPGVDLSRSPLLNVDFIAGWKPASGIDVHWSVNGLLNLLASRQICLTIIAACIFILLGWRRGTTSQRRWTMALLAICALHFGLLVFILAIDPKPRMFAMDAAILASLAGIWGALLWRNGSRLIVAALVGLLLIFGVTQQFAVANFSNAERVAGQWIAATPAGLTTDINTASILALAPNIGRVAITAQAPPGPRIEIAMQGCAARLEIMGVRAWRIDRSLTLHDNDPPAWTGLPPERSALCLFVPV